MLGNRQNHNLDGCNLGGQHQTIVVAVGHDDAANQPGGNTPGSLEGVGALVVLIGEGNVKGLCKAVTEIVGSTGLECLAVVHHALHGIGCLSTVELLLIGLLAAGDRHRQHIFAEIGIQIQHLLRERLGLLGGGVHGVPFLPQKLPVAQEGATGFLPAQHAAPLVILHGQVTVGLNHLGEVVAEQRLGSGTDAVALLQLLVAAHGHPGALGSEALHMVFLLLQQALRNQHGHIHILNAHLFKFCIHNMLHILPDGITIGAINKDALHGSVVNQLRLLAHVGEPLGKIHLHVGNLLNLFIFGHFLSSRYCKTHSAGFKNNLFQCIIP